MPLLLPLFRLLRLGQEQPGEDKARETGKRRYITGVVGVHKLSNAQRVKGQEVSNSMPLLQLVVQDR